MMRTMSILSLGLIMVAAACTEDTTTPIEPQFGINATGPGGAATYEVTVYNLTSGQPFTPTLAAVHRQSIDFFDVGDEATVQIQEIAENGNLDPMLEYLDGHQHVTDVVVTFGPNAPPPPVMPGESVTFTIEGETGAKYLSFASMLICTNDGFTGVSGQRLPKGVGDSETAYLMAYDAGTEMNTEDFDDLVPPCGPLTGFPGGQGTDMSNTDLYEGGVVAPHEGIAGAADLDPSLHGWEGAVGMISVERIG